MDVTFIGGNIVESLSEFQSIEYFHIRKHCHGLPTISGVRLTRQELGQIVASLKIKDPKRLVTINSGRHRFYPFAVLFCFSPKCITIINGEQHISLLKNEWPAMWKSMSTALSKMDWGDAWGNCSLNCGSLSRKLMFPLLNQQHLNQQQHLRCKRERINHILWWQHLQATKTKKTKVGAWGKSSREYTGTNACNMWTLSSSMDSCVTSVVICISTGTS